MSEVSRRGKIASFPVVVREELNTRLLDGQRGPQILPWLNSLPAVLVVLDEQWAEQPVSAENLSDWRKGGYADWLARREKVESLKVLSDYSLKLAAATGKNLSDGSAAIAGGRILELLEAASDDDLHALVESLTKLRRTDLEALKSQQRERLLAQNDEKISLERQKFQRSTAELFLEFYADKKAKEIAESRGSKDVKMDQIMELMFGTDPNAAKEGAA